MNIRLVPLAAGLLFVAGTVAAATIDTSTILGNGVRDTEVYISKTGAVSLSGAKVMQLAGRSFYTRLYWGDSYVRLLVKTSPATTIVRGTGEATSYTEITEGDILNMQGSLESGSDSLVLVPTYIKDVSVQKAQSSLSGTVTALNPAANSFTLNSKTQGSITVATDGSTLFTKGSRTVDLAHVLIGDAITSTSGTFDYNSKTLTASAVTIYSNAGLYTWQNFEGKLLTTPGSGASELSISIGGTTYSVELPSDIIVWNTARKGASLSRFVAGDTVRLHGKRRETDAPIIDADIVRDMNF